MRTAPPRSAAAPGTSHDARTRPVPNHTAPVETGSRAAVERAGGATALREAVPRAAAAAPHLVVIAGGAIPRTRGMEELVVITDGAARRSPPTPRLTVITGGPVSGAGIAGMAGPAGAGRPGTFEVPSP